jgi:hypothetical protein
MAHRDVRSGAILQFVITADIATGGIGVAK